MNWKKLLTSNLGQLFSRKSEEDVLPSTPRYFWSVLLDFVLRRTPRDVADALDTIPYPTSLVRKVGNPRWRGPVYRSGRAWRHDVLSVAEYIRSLIASNVPLAEGMAAAAQEEYRKRTRWTPQQMTRLSTVLMLLVAGVFFAVNIAQNINGLASLSTVLQAVILVGLVLLLVRHLFLSKNRRLAVFLALQTRLDAGAGIAEAMESLPRFFPRHLADLVRVGEETGELDDAFAQFNGTTLRAMERHRQLHWVLRYLGAVVMLQGLILVFLGIKVLPVFIEITEEIYEDHSTAVETPTYLNTAYGAASLVDHAIYHWPQWAMGGAVFLLCFAALRFRSRRGWASGPAAFPLLFVPWIRGLIVRQNLSQIALMLHGLLRCGVPLDRALGMCSSTDVHPAYRDWLSALRESLRGGASLREGLAHTRRKGLIPDTFVGQVEAGEYSGQLPTMLERISTIYAMEAEKRMQILVAIVLPVGILCLGYITASAQILAFQLLIGLAESLLV